MLLWSLSTRFNHNTSAKIPPGVGVVYVFGAGFWVLSVVHSGELYALELHCIKTSCETTTYRV